MGAAISPPVTIAGSLPVWAALRTSSVERRFEALHASGLTTLVGREEEYELLRRRWARAKNGEGQAVAMTDRWDAASA
jgi:hypothetical protein